MPDCATPEAAVVAAKGPMAAEATAFELGVWVKGLFHDPSFHVLRRFGQLLEQTCRWKVGERRVGGR